MQFLKAEGEGFIPSFSLIAILFFVHSRVLAWVLKPQAPGPGPEPQTKKQSRPEGRDQREGEGKIYSLLASAA